MSRKHVNIALCWILLSSDRVRYLYANLAKHLLAVAYNDPTDKRGIDRHIQLLPSKQIGVFRYVRISLDPSTGFG